MKILNNKKTHFMQANTVGSYTVKFGTVSEVRALIDTILDGKQEKQPNGHSHKIETDTEQKPNH
ncbi:MAG: hypothetical protein V4575_07350 [Pseudomonadota bacterium]